MGFQPNPLPVAVAYLLGMKTLILHIAEPAHEAAVLAALTDLLDKKMIALDTGPPLGWPGAPLDARAYAARLTAALAAPRVSAEAALQRLGI